MKTILFALAITASILPTVSTPANAQDRAKALSLYEFVGNSGYDPGGGVITDQHGTIFGTTTIGGSGPCSGGAGCGTVYALSPPSKKSAQWTYQVLHDFQSGADGEVPFAPLVTDDSGNLYGYAYGTPGTVFELSPSKAPSHEWTYQVIYTFTGQADGDLLDVDSPLIFLNGDLYGVASGGSKKCGQFGCGSVFRLVPGADGGAWTEETLFNFTGGDKSGQPTWITGFDSSGAVYVSTSLGNGAIARISPPASGTAWTEDVITRFKNSGNMSYPTNLILAADGSVFGIAASAHGGLAFQLTPPTGGGSKWTRKTIANIEEHRYGPVSLAPQAGGSLIGVIEGDFDFFAGSVFQLTPPEGGDGAWTYTELWNFNQGPDRNPLNVVTGRGGHLYGVLNGGDSSNGSLFELH